MKIPSTLFGIYQDVLAHCRQMVTAMKRGVSFDEAIGSKDLLESSSVSGLLVLHGPSPLIGGEPHTHLYLPVSTIDDAILKGRLKRDTEDNVFAACCAHPWGTLTLISPTNLIWLHPQVRHRPFLEACMCHWEELVAEGDRYSLGSPHGQELWEHTTNLKHILARRGIPISELNRLQSPHSVIRLIKEVL